MTEKVLGIDLGTSYSVACVYIDGKPTMIPSAEGYSMQGKAFPSYVAFTEDGQLLVGLSAKYHAVTNPENTVSEIKRHMGTDYKVNIQGKEYTPQKISAMILQKIKRDAESFLGEPIEKAVITVPAYFDDNQRTATRDAGRIAGLQVLRLINEPTAACLAYGIDKQQENDINILIFDLGRGTLDITIMEFADGIFNVLSEYGDTHLGGTDMDNVLINYFAEEFEMKYGIDLTQDEDTRRRLREGVEKAKIELSNLPETTVKLPFIAMGNDGSPLNLDEKISRSKLEELVRPIVERCGQSIDQAIQDADLTINDIDKVILVGAPTRMPIVQEYVEQYMGKLIEKGIDSMECVAIGAAIQGTRVDPKSEIIIEYVTPFSIRYENPDGTTSILVERNTWGPFFKKQIFKANYDNQDEFEVKLYIGENKMACDNRYVGTFTLSGIQPTPKGKPIIELTLESDFDYGIITITGEELSTGKKQSMVLSNIFVFSQEEIDKLIKDSIAEAEKQQEQYLKEIEKKKKQQEQYLKEIEKKKKHMQKLVNEIIELLYYAETYITKPYRSMDLNELNLNEIEELLKKLRFKIKK